MTDQQLTRAALRVWIARCNGQLSPAAIDDQRPLFAQRILKSVHLAELILFVEELRGRAVDLEQIKPGAFTSIDAIMTHFFTEQAL